MKGLIDKILDSKRITYGLILGGPFIIGLLGFNDGGIYVLYVILLTLFFIISGMIEEGGILEWIPYVIIGPFLVGILLLLPWGAGLFFNKLIVDDALIKGNISYETHEKIYHVPGCKHYDDTVINTSDGEKWFRTEKEAINAGWRKCRTDDRYY